MQRKNVWVSEKKQADLFNWEVYTHLPRADASPENVGKVPRISSHDDWQPSSPLWCQYERLEEVVLVLFCFQMPKSHQKIPRHEEKQESMAQPNQNKSLGTDAKEKESFTLTLMTTLFTTGKETTQYQWQMNELTTSGVCIQWNIIQSSTRRSYHMLQCGWNLRTSCYDISQLEKDK